jgi:hypothetical protein
MSRGYCWRKICCWYWLSINQQNSSYQGFGLAATPYALFGRDLVQMSVGVSRNFLSLRSNSGILPRFGISHFHVISDSSFIDYCSWCHAVKNTNRSVQCTKKKKKNSSYTYPAASELTGNVHLLVKRQLCSRCERKEWGPKHKPEENKYKKIKAKCFFSTPGRHIQ